MQCKYYLNSYLPMANSRFDYWNFLEFFFKYIDPRLVESIVYSMTMEEAQVPSKGERATQRVWRCSQCLDNVGSCRPNSRCWILSLMKWKVIRGFKDK